MAGWLESVAGPEYANALMWTIFALIGLLVLLVLIRIVRSFTFGTFIAGGRNRKARLAVMDATAVDSHRRLVLVRRDDVEHLILIGGPTDVVVEQGIRLHTPVRRPVVEETHAPAVEEQRPAARVAPVAAQPSALPPAPEQPPLRELPPQPAARTMPEPVREERRPAPMPVQAAPVQRPVPERPAPAPAPAMPPRSAAPAPASRFSTIAATAPGASVAPPVQPIAPEAPAAPRVTPAAPVAGAYATMRPVAPAAPAETVPAASSSDDNLDDALLQELQVSLDQEPGDKPAGAPARERALEEEMSRLLGDLTARK